MFRVNLQEVFDRVVADDDNCEGCEYRNFYHGDSWDCVGNKFDCQQVQEKKDEIEQYMSDLKEEFELIEWTD